MRHLFFYAYERIQIRIGFGSVPEIRENISGIELSLSNEAVEF